MYPGVCWGKERKREKRKERNKKHFQSNFMWGKVGEDRSSRQHLNVSDLIITKWHESFIHPVCDPALFRKTGRLTFQRIRPKITLSLTGSSTYLEHTIRVTVDFTRPLSQGTLSTCGEGSRSCQSRCSSFKVSRNPTNLCSGSLSLFYGSPYFSVKEGSKVKGGTVRNPSTPVPWFFTPFRL